MNTTAGSVFSTTLTNGLSGTASAAALELAATAAVVPAGRARRVEPCAHAEPHHRPTRIRMNAPTK
jgi:hypothetical protein